MSRTVNMTWKVEQQHTKSFTEKEWAAFVDSLREGYPNNTSDEAMDLVYEYLEDGSFNAVTILQDLASPGTWLDHGEAEITDLHVEEG